MIPQRMVCFLSRRSLSLVFGITAIFCTHHLVLGVDADFSLPDEDGHITPFFGKTLTGWRENPPGVTDGTGDKWYVEDGAIIREQDLPGSENGGILLTDAKFGDFDLVVGMNHDWGRCSGLFLRSNDRGECLQMMVDFHNDGSIGHIYRAGTCSFNLPAFSTWKAK